MTPSRAKTTEFRDRLANGATLDDLAIEAFAVTREAARRVIGQRHYDVQFVGGAALHFGMVAEMKTGEGKTWSPHCRPISTACPVRVCIWSRSTITSPAVTVNGWVGFTPGSALRWDS
jgi:hypothetical protein